MKNESLTPDPSPKSEGSRMNQGFEGFKRILET